MLALDADKGAPLRAWADALGKPRAILAFSAHWERAPLTLGATRTLPLIYDFNGFDPALQRIDYPAPARSEEHTSELQSRLHLVCRLLLEKKKQNARTR